jgi:hypothetical protein
MPQRSNLNSLRTKQGEALVETLNSRFERHMACHKGVQWSKVQAQLVARAHRLWSLSEMERTGGEPDVVGQDRKTSEYIFFDCSTESPKGRRSVCYDPEALRARKKHKPGNSAVYMTGREMVCPITPQSGPPLLSDFGPTSGVSTLSSVSRMLQALA